MSARTVYFVGWAGATGPHVLGGPNAWNPQPPKSVTKAETKDAYIQNMMAASSGIAGVGEMFEAEILSQTGEQVLKSADPKEVFDKLMELGQFAQYDNRANDKSYVATTEDPPVWFYGFNLPTFFTLLAFQIWRTPGLREICAPPFRFWRNPPGVRCIQDLLLGSALAGGADVGFLLGQFLRTVDGEQFAQQCPQVVPYAGNRLIGDDGLLLPGALLRAQAAYGLGLFAKL